MRLSDPYHILNMLQDSLPVTHFRKTYLLCFLKTIFFLCCNAVRKVLNISSKQHVSTDSLTKSIIKSSRFTPTRVMVANFWATFVIKSQFCGHIKAKILMLKTAAERQRQTITFLLVSILACTWLSVCLLPKFILNFSYYFILNSQKKMILGYTSTTFRSFTVMVKDLMLFFSKILPLTI